MLFFCCNCNKVNLQIYDNIVYARSDRMKYYDEFVKGKWCDTIDVENFIELNYKEYLGDEKFLCKS